MMTTTITTITSTAYQHGIHRLPLLLLRHKKGQSLYFSSFSNLKRLQSVKIHRRHQSSFSLPQATWSLRQLQLSNNNNPTTAPSNKCTNSTSNTSHTLEQSQSSFAAPALPTITNQELDSLAKRCLIDINEDDNEREQLKQNLNNILHCTSLVCNISQKTNLTEQDLYDIPRGLGFDSSSPLRQDQEDSGSTTTNTSSSKRKKQELRSGTVLQDECEVKEVLHQLEQNGNMVPYVKETHHEQGESKGEREHDWYFSLVTKDGKDAS